MRESRARKQQMSRRIGPRIRDNVNWRVTLYGVTLQLTLP